MKAYLLSVVSIILISTILNIILPDGKIGKFINGIFAILIVCVMVQPIKILKNNFQTQDYVNFNKQIIDKEVVEIINKLKIDAKKETVNNILIYHGINDSELEFEYNLIDYEILYKKVQINLKNAVINSDQPHINIIEQARKNVADYMNINIDSVIFYE